MFSWYWMMKYSCVCCSFLSSFSESCVMSRSSSKVWLICRCFWDMASTREPDGEGLCTGYRLCSAQWGDSPHSPPQGCSHHHGEEPLSILPTLQHPLPLPSQPTLTLFASRTSRCSW